jgi:hypothetical protein
MRSRREVHSAQPVDDERRCAPQIVAQVVPRPGPDSDFDAVRRIGDTEWVAIAVDHQRRDAGAQLGVPRALRMAGRMQRKCQGQHAGGADGDGRTARDSGTAGAPAHDEWKVCVPALVQRRDHRSPGLIEVRRGRGRTPTRDPVRLRHERDHDPVVTDGIPDCHKVGRVHAATGAVPQDKQATDRPGGTMDRHFGWAARRWILRHPTIVRPERPGQCDQIARIAVAI